MNKNITIILSLAVIIAATGGYVYLARHPYPTPTVHSTESVSPAATPAVGATPSLATSATVKATASISTKDCGTDLSCFSAQASTCGPATATYSFRLYTTTITTYLKVTKTSNSNMCSFTERSSLGTQSVCAVPPKDMVAMMTRWKAGDFNGSEDINPYACTFSDSKKATSFTTSPTSHGDTVASHGYTYSSNEGVGGGMSIAAFSYKTLAIENNSMTLSFTNNNTKQTGTVTAQVNVPVVFAGYTFIVNSIDQYNNASLDIKSN
jgi:hypothetical protein